MELFGAVQRGELETVRALLHAGVDKASRDLPEIPETHENMWVVRYLLKNPKTRGKNAIPYYPYRGNIIFSGWFLSK